jgi:hypothetical protein
VMVAGPLLLPPADGLVPPPQPAMAAASATAAAASTGVRIKCTISAPPLEATNFSL